MSLLKNDKKFQQILMKEKNLQNKLNLLDHKK